MSDLFFATMKRLTPALLEGDLTSCEAEVARVLNQLSRTPFHIVLELSIANSAQEAAEHFGRFFVRESERFKLGAAYTEMNGFDINPKMWFCSLFAYAADGGNEEYDWISDWQSRPFEDYVIRGLEELQDVYASAAFKDKNFRTASFMCSLMVVIKFQQFMFKAAGLMKQLAFPLYVTAHDFDFIASFDPRPESLRTPVVKPTLQQKLQESLARLESTNQEERFWGAVKLGGLGAAAKSAIPALIRLLDDSDIPTRQSAVHSLAQIDPASEFVVLNLVRKFQEGQPTNVMQEIIRALGRCESKEGVAVLISAIANTDRSIRWYAAISLKLLGAKAKHAVPALENLLEVETDEAIKSQAKAALDRMLRE